MSTRNFSRKSSRAGSTRLATITERGGIVPSPPIPRKSSRRVSSPSLSSRPNSRDGATFGSRRTAPPAYDWVPDPAVGANDNNDPVEGEKLAGLRRDTAFRKPRSRGGWGRLILIVGGFILLVIALGVGLGVGISHRKSHKSSNGGTGSTGSGSNAPPQKFPLGQYSFVTALTTVQTSCVSNPATWRCYPFTTYDASNPSTSSSSLAYFNWIINNTESKYATASTGEFGSMPANLTLSSVADYFGITFGTKDLTYVASSSNSSSARYTFTFTMDKKVVPSPAITSSSEDAICFFNQSTFTGNIYLSATRNFPSGSEANSTSIGGFEQWPYAVEVLQTASGGSNVPNCYETTGNGVVGAPITANITAEASDSECLCEYRNY